MSQVNVTQVVAEVMVPFTEGNSTAAGPQTMRIGTGNGNAYYAVAPLTDSGNEERSKTLTAMRATGKFTNVSLQAYGYDVETPINITDLEDGANASVTVAISDSTEVAQSARQQINVANAVLHTVRIEGDDTGEATRDRLDELLVTGSIMGVRR